MGNENFNNLINRLKGKNKCKCGALIKDKYNYCPNCGSFLLADTNSFAVKYAYICPVCKKELDKFYCTYCHNCGHRLKR